MKQSLLALTASVAMLAAGQVNAREYVVPEVEIISVAPRSPDVKPYVMSLPADGRPEHIKTQEKTPVAADQSSARKPEQTASAQQK
jgi:hypothetical protein